MSNPTAKKDQAQHSINQAGQNVKEGASAVMDKVKEGANTAYDKAKDAAGHAGDAVSSAASAVGRQAENTVGTVGSGMQSLADTVRDRAPQEGVLGSAARGVASALDSSGKYIEDKNLSGMAEDLTSMIKNNPIPALLVGVGLGFLLGRALRS